MFPSSRRFCRTVWECPRVPQDLFHPVLSTGKTIWTLNSIHLSDGILAAPAATLPDVDGDGIRDIVVLALKETQVQHVCAQD